MIETEDKFRVHQRFDLPALHSDDGPVRVTSKPRSQVLDATYYDTDDLRLARAGVTLRHRTGETPAGWQLKLPVRGERVGVRQELHVDGEPDTIPESLRALATGYTRGAELSPRARLRTERTIVELMGPSGDVLAELVDDRVEAHDGNRPVTRFREIEVEDRGGGSDVLDHVGSLLRSAGAIGGEFQPKAVRALGERATSPPDPPPPGKVSRSDPARAVVTALLRQHTRALLSYDAAVRLREEDAIHQMRVSARRLRSTLTDLEDLLDREWAVRLQEELRWLGGALAAARDGEVMEARLLAALLDLPPDAVVKDADTRLRRSLDAENAGAEQAVDAALSSERYVQLLDDLVDAAMHPRTVELADQPCADVIPKQVQKSWRRLARRVRNAQQTGDPHDFHRARIAAKRSRYLAEGVTQVFGKPARRYAAQVERVQDVLGAHQDTVVARETLRRIATAPRVGRAAFTFGALHQLQAHEGKRLRAKLDRIWPKVSRRRLRRWIRS